MKRGEGRSSLCRERQQALSTVGSRARPVKEATPFEAPQDATQIAGVHLQLLADLGRGEPVAVRELVEDARLGQGERAVEVALVQQADLPRVETVEAPHGRHAPVELRLDHALPPETARVQVLAKVNHIH
jgi:hypothetical protein